MTDTTTTVDACDECPGTGRILDDAGQLAHYCEACDAGREAESEDCDYCDGSGLCDDLYSHGRVACQCPAGQSIIDADTDARDSAEYGRQPRRAIW